MIDLEQRLKRKGWTVTDSGCWEWAASKGTNGYGRVSCGNQKMMSAHRAAYETWVGPIPEGEIVRHRCDNPPCINPDHLVSGTYADNTKDKVVRGRANSPHGERHWNSKLTDAEVQDIVNEYAKGILTQKMLAEVHGVARRTVGKIIERKGWAHVNV